MAKDDKYIALRPDTYRKLVELKAKREIELGRPQSFNAVVAWLTDKENQAQGLR